MVVNPGTYHDCCAPVVMRTLFLTDDPRKTTAPLRGWEALGTSRAR